MNTFLQEAAVNIRNEVKDLNSATVVFPNRRAAIYFRKHLGDLISKPTFSPALLTIEQFFQQFSGQNIPEKLQLIHVLHQAYTEVLREAGRPNEVESFEKFYFWGDMLLRDFDEADKYLVNVDLLFKDLSHQKELDTNFDYLTDEQKEFLQSFWQSFEEHQAINKKRFLYIWRNLPAVYHRFRKKLEEGGYAYSGMQHRSVAEALQANLFSARIDSRKRYFFIGFNALTKAEELLISHFVEQYDARVSWDIDSYYYNSENQEAGKYFKEYSAHRTLQKTFTTAPSNLTSRTKPVKLYAATQPIGQVKMMAEIVHQQLIDQQIKPEETLIVLPDEKLLIPVLHSVSGSVEKLNVTMGFPLSQSPMFNLLELVIELQINKKNNTFNHRQVLAVLGHPYIVAANPSVANAKRKEIIRQNWVNVPATFLAADVDVHRVLFGEASRAAGSANEFILDYISRVIREVGSIPFLSDIDKEYAHRFHQIVNTLDSVMTDAGHSISGEETGPGNRKAFQNNLRSLLKLLRQLVRSEKMPFSGEPLRGLQIMGVLETRNLDFKNVFILSLNEGSFPANGSRGSYIPFNIRKAYGLPTPEHQDAMYAYLFYRVLQRAENIHLFYNSETDVLGQGEMSRYLQQLIYESGIPIEKNSLRNQVQPLGVKPISILKNDKVLADLYKINEGNHKFKGISPSALNTYLECQLKFYFRHVAKIKEPNEVEEELDARVLGNFLHDVMENFYKKLRARKNSKKVESADLEQYEKQLDPLIDEVFIRTYKLDPEKKVVYEGQGLIVKEIVRKFAGRILEFDKAYAPFELEGLEQEGMALSVKLNHPPHRAIISGKIDRVDRKENTLRIIDYKTGKDKMGFENIESLFSPSASRNKAAFQTFLYALLYKKSHMTHGEMSTYKVVPGLMNRINLFEESFSFGLKAGKEQIKDIEPLLPEFEERLSGLLHEVFDPAIAFNQTTETDHCKLCPYTRMCYR